MNYFHGINPKTGSYYEKPLYYRKMNAHYVSSFFTKKSSSDVSNSCAQFSLFPIKIMIEGYCPDCSQWIPLIFPYSRKSQCIIPDASITDPEINDNVDEINDEVENHTILSQDKLDISINMFHWYKHKQKCTNKIHF